MIRVINENDFEQVVELSQYAFQYKLTDEEKKKAFKRFSTQHILGDFEDGKLMAKTHTFHFQVVIQGKPFKMGGLASVSTWPEARRNKKVASLIEKSLEWMNREGFSLSYLHPFSIAFYRKFGWELICSKKNLTIKKVDLQFLAHSDGSMKRLEKEEAIPVLNTIYEKFMQENNSMLVRTNSWWKETTIKDDYTIAVHYNEENEADGYILYKIENRLFSCEEVVSLTEKAKKAIWNFVCQHDSMVDEVSWMTYEDDPLPYYLANPRVKTEIHPYFMGRIVNVEQFLREYPFVFKDNKRLILHVYDPICEWNNGTFFIEESGVKVFQKESGACVHKPRKGLQVDIGSLTSILLGYVYPTSLYKGGKVTGEYEEAVKLEQMIIRKPSILFDFF
ncbi:enhanced intracellular survival protein Eis [Metabacillus fastidiosus]|uniref:GNAT family N-acetyltransferase n=1 Tax=Metabacillus fastidiosus TaxID=1458 RepID=UPI002E251388|nr:GNAT family N-acetyltransferase [Metabacillus fastidiosus]